MRGYLRSGPGHQCALASAFVAPRRVAGGQAETELGPLLELPRAHDGRPAEAEKDQADEIGVLRRHARLRHEAGKPGRRDEQPYPENQYHPTLPAARSRLRLHGTLPHVMSM